MKRLCIYLIYDKQNIIDKYIGFMLKELKNCTDYLAVVCNMLEIVQGTENIEPYADEIFYRENIGLDAGGFKDALTKFIGWEKILGFEEVVLVNDSLFGPFCPMRDIFDEMDKRSVDFWGLAGHGVYKREGAESFPEHIQSYFIAIRNPMLQDELFQHYWEKLPYYESYEKVVWEHEMQFTSYFAKAGYKYSFFADVEGNNSLNLANNYRQYRMIPDEMIKKRNFPFLKKQQMSEERLEEQTQEGVYRAIEYIDKETDYDVDMIWSNIIRTLNMSDLQRNLHFRYIIPTEILNKEYDKKVAVIVRVSYQKSAEYILEYLDGIDCEIKVVADDDVLLVDYRNNGLNCSVVEKENWGAFLTAFCSYDYVCMLNDVDITSEVEPNYIGKSYLFAIWNNLFKNKNHISGIIEMFEKHPRLGMLAAPQPIFGKYFGALGKGWDGNFEKIFNIVQKQKISCQLSEDKPPFGIPQDLWIRGKLLEKLNGWTAEELQYLPYLWIYLAQDSGYFSGIVDSAEYAALNEINMQLYLEQIVDLVRYQYGDIDYIYELKGRISQAALSDFCLKYRHIFIYGTGVYARRYKMLIPKPEAFVVSDRQKKLAELDGIPVKYLSEIETVKDCGIVLCMNRKNQIQVIELLKERGFQNYLCI